MDKDKSQIEHNGPLHHHQVPENSTQQHVNNISELEVIDQEAEMDALESRLFAMAKSRC